MKNELRLTSLAYTYTWGRGAGQGRIQPTGKSQSLQHGEKNQFPGDGEQKSANDCEWRIAA